jgi:hypothetical protein
VVNLLLLQFTAHGLNFSLSPFPVAFLDTYSTMEDFSVTARTSGASNTTMVDVMEEDFVAGGGPLEQLAGTRDSTLFLYVPPQDKLVSPPFPSLLDGLLLGDFTKPWLSGPSTSTTVILPPLSLLQDSNLDWVNSITGGLSHPPL